MNKIFFGFIILIIAVIIVFVFLLPKNSEQGTNPGLDLFAQCLADKGVIMYGAYWCSHCQNQKSLFGDSFKYVNYVECTSSPGKCSSAGVSGYPTWIFTDGKKLEGEQKLEILSQESGCVLGLDEEYSEPQP